MTKEGWKKTQTILIIAILVSSIPLIGADDYEPMADSEITMTPSYVEVVDADTFNITVEVFPEEYIDAIATDLITFNPSYIRCTNFSYGNLFNDQTVQVTPEINNSVGNVQYICWGAIAETNTSGIFFNLTFEAVAQGISSIIIDGGEAGAAFEGFDVPLTIANAVTVNVTSYNPGPPSDLDATVQNKTAVQLDWTIPAMTDSVWIEWHVASFPWDRGEGTVVANVSSPTAIWMDEPLDPGTVRYYRAWSYNATSNYWSSTSSNAAHAQTDDNTAPSCSAEIPTTGTTLDEPRVNWSIYIEDTDDATFDWSIECSDGNSSQATADVDGRKYLNMTGLTYGTTYDVWVNASDPFVETNEHYTFSIRDLYLPDEPQNFHGAKLNETAVNLTWIQDLIADTTYIEVHNESTWARGEGNEIYNQSGEWFTYDELVPATYYFQAWSYNATDNLYSATYNETAVVTGSNHDPTLTAATPHDVTDISIYQTDVSITLADQEEDYMTYTIGSPYITPDVTGSGNNGTYTAAVDTPLPYDTNITWWVNVSDGFVWVNETYWFETESNTPVVQENPLPARDETQVDIINDTVSITLSDAQDNPISYTIHSPYMNTDATGDDVGNGTYTGTLNVPLPHDTNITWYVNATDGYVWSNETYWFQTRPQYEPDPPTSVGTEVYGANQINISWIEATTADRTTIETNYTGDWVEIHNASATYFEHTGLDGHSTYYYRISSYNDTDGERSIYTYVNNTTENTPPNQPTSITVSSRTGFGKEYTSVYDVHLSVNVSDAEKDSLDVTFYWQDGTPLGLNGSVTSGETAMLNISKYNSNLSYWKNPVSGDWEPRNFLNHSYQKNVTGVEIGINETQTYYWYVIIDDGIESTQSEIYSFNTSGAADCDESCRVYSPDVSKIIASYGEILGVGGEIGADIDNSGRVYSPDVSQLVFEYGKIYHTP